MRQFILGANAAYASSITSMTAGQIGIVGLDDDGAQTLITSSNIASYLKKPLNIVTVTDFDGTKELFYPLFVNNFSYSKSEYEAATTYSSSLTISDVTAGVDYTIIVAKKGIKFNERNKWTATVHATSSDTADTVAEKLVTLINANTVGSGMTAENSSGTITFTAEKEGFGYVILPADALMGVEVTVSAEGNKAINDDAAIKDMMMKAASDAGFSYTYNKVEGIYPALGGNWLGNFEGSDTGWTVYTLRFTEPRMVGTRNDFVNQIVQIALPTGASAISTLDTIFAAMV